MFRKTVPEGRLIEVIRKRSTMHQTRTASTTQEGHKHHDDAKVTAPPVWSHIIFASDLQLKRYAPNISKSTSAPVLVEFKILSLLCIPVG